MATDYTEYRHEKRIKNVCRKSCWVLFFCRYYFLIVCHKLWASWNCPPSARLKGNLSENFKFSNDSLDLENVQKIFIFNSELYFRLRKISVELLFYFFPELLFCCQASSQLQLQLDWASLISTSLPPSHPATHPATRNSFKMTWNINQSSQMRFTKLQMEDNLNLMANGRQHPFLANGRQPPFSC